MTTFFVGFSNDSQTWVMYTNGYEEMVGARVFCFALIVWARVGSWESRVLHRGLFLSRPSMGMWTRTRLC